MNLKQFAEEYQKTVSEIDLMDFVGAWKAHLTDLKEQYIKDKESLDLDDIDQAKRHLLLDKTILILNMVNSFIDTREKPFPSGGMVTGSSMPDLLEKGERIFEHDPKPFKDFMNEQSTNDK